MTISTDGGRTAIDNFVFSSTKIWYPGSIFASFGSGGVLREKPKRFRLGGTGTTMACRGIRDRRQQCTTGLTSEYSALLVNCLNTLAVNWYRIISEGLVVGMWKHE